MALLIFGVAIVVAAIITLAAVHMLGTPDNTLPARFYVLAAYTLLSIGGLCAVAGAILALIRPT